LVQGFLGEGLKLTAESDSSFFVRDEDIPLPLQGFKNVRVTFHTAGQGGLISGLTLRLGAQDIPARRIGP
jgi:hypothetical protein